MNKTLFGAIMFTVGAAIGSAVTYKVVKTKYEQIANEEIASVKETYADLMDKMKKMLNDTASYEGSQDSDEAIEDEEDDDEYYPDDDERDFTAAETAQIEYYKITSKYRASEHEEDDENNEEGDEGEDDEVPYINGPYVISPDEFSCSPPGYNAQPLDYFADGILADSWGVILDLDETIGEDSVEHFGEYDDDIIYVRNERTEIDYEVTKDPRTYAEVVRLNPDPYYGKYEN